jgi:RNA polymerase sigma factor (sigma-70 family)
VNAFDVLIAHRPRFLSYVRSRLSDRAAAEDVLQVAYTRVIERPDQVPAGHEVAWFYRVLGNGAVDRHRRAAAEARGREAWEVDPTRQPEPPKGRPCRCTLRALSSLKPQYIHIIEQVDLHGRSVVDVARAEGLSPTNAYVRLHRARRLLGDRLRAICRSCAENACADCHCKGSADPA